MKYFKLLPILILLIFSSCEQKELVEPSLKNGSIIELFADKPVTYNYTEEGAAFMYKSEKNLVLRKTGQLLITIMHPEGFKGHIRIRDTDSNITVDQRFSSAGDKIFKYE